MIPFIFLYGGGRSVVVDGDRDISGRRIHIILLAISVFFGDQAEELDRTKAQQPCSLLMMYRWSACPWMCQTGADGTNTTTSMFMMCHVGNTMVVRGYGWKLLSPRLANMKSYVKPYLVAKTHPTTTP